MTFVKRSVSLHGHRTSVALEPAFWEVIDSHIQAQGIPLARFIADIDDSRDQDAPLSSALRVWALTHVARGDTRP